MRRSARFSVPIALCVALAAAGVARGQSAVPEPVGTFISIDDPAPGQARVSPVQGASSSVFGVWPFPGGPGPTAPGGHIGSTLVTKPVDQMSIRVASAADNGGVLTSALLVSWEVNGTRIRPTTEYCLLDAHIFSIQTSGDSETITLNPSDVAVSQFTYDKGAFPAAVDTWRLQGGDFPSRCGGMTVPRGPFALPPEITSQSGEQSTAPQKSKACRRAESRVRRARARLKTAQRKFHRHRTKKNRHAVSSARRALTSATKARRRAC
jgi:hypothetical protein